MSTVSEEIGLSCLLLVGYWLRWVGYASAVLLLLFALGMTFAYGVKAPLDYSVFSASAAAFLVGATASGTSSETTPQEHSTHVSPLRSHCRCMAITAQRLEKR